VISFCLTTQNRQAKKDYLPDEVPPPLDERDPIYLTELELELDRVVRSVSAVEDPYP